MAPRTRPRPRWSPRISGASIPAIRTTPRSSSRSLPSGTATTRAACSISSSTWSPRSEGRGREEVPMAMTAGKQTVFDWIDQHRAELSEQHLLVWNFAEPAWREYRSAAFFVDLLRKAGFEVEAGSATMPTAFCATFGHGKPVLGAYAEYDAVPGMSQAPVTYRKPRDGFHRSAAGHTDPHSALGMGALAGVLGARAAMERHRLPGTIKFFGEPAEKVCGSKPVHAAHGYYDDLDAAISFHP